MPQELHLSNPFFFLKPGTEITVPSGAIKNFICPRQKSGRGLLPKIACLQQRSVRRGGVRIYYYQFNIDDEPSTLGFKLFLPDGLTAGDKVVVIWRDQTCAAAVRPQDVEAYKALFMTPALEHYPPEVHKD